MILLKVVIEVYVCPVPNRFAELTPDRGRVGVVPISRDLVWNNLSHRFGGTKECFCSSEVAMLAQHHVHQVAVAIIALVVLWRLRYKLSLRDLAEMFLVRGIVFSHEAVRDWEAKLTPALAEELRHRRRRRIRRSWYVDETFIKVHGQWRYLYRAIGARALTEPRAGRDLWYARPRSGSLFARTGGRPVQNPSVGSVGVATLHKSSLVAQPPTAGRICAQV